MLSLFASQSELALLRAAPDESEHQGEAAQSDRLQGEGGWAHNLGQEEVDRQVASLQSSGGGAGQKEADLQRLWSDGAEAHNLGQKEADLNRLWSEGQEEVERLQGEAVGLREQLILARTTAEEVFPSLHNLLRSFVSLHNLFRSRLPWRKAGLLRSSRR